MSQGGYGAYNAYISAATRYAALGAPTLYDPPGSIYGSKHGGFSLQCNSFLLLKKIKNRQHTDSLFCYKGGEPARGLGKKIFVGRLPPEATAEDLRQYFGRFGRILDVYVPKVRYQQKNLPQFGCPVVLKTLKH